MKKIILLSLLFVLCQNVSAMDKKIPEVLGELAPLLPPKSKPEYRRKKKKLRFREISNLSAELHKKDSLPQISSLLEEIEKIKNTETVKDVASAKQVIEKISILRGKLLYLSSKQPHNIYIPKIIRDLNEIQAVVLILKGEIFEMHNYKSAIKKTKQFKKCLDALEKLDQTNFVIKIKREIQIEIDEQSFFYRLEKAEKIFNCLFFCL